VAAAGTEPAPYEPLAHLASRPRQGDTPQRRLGRTLSRAMGSESSEVHALTDDLRGIQQPVTTCRRILVADVRGGAGATTLTALLASAYARYRADGALALETTRGHGSLAFRLGTARWLAPEEASSLVRMPPGEAVAALSHQHRQATLLARPGAMDLDEYRDMSTRLMRFFGLAVIDGGHDAVVQPGYLADGHSLVLAIPATLDGMRTALAWFAETDPDLRRRTVPVLVEHSPDTGVNLARAAESLRNAGAPVCGLGYDRSLAAGAPLQPALFAHLTTPAIVRIAAVALSLANADRG
jgi:Mrp family chromosome partitioning ATPase